jgi:hypothetical protein
MVCLLPVEVSGSQPVVRVPPVVVVGTPKIISNGGKQNKFKNKPVI